MLVNLANIRQIYSKNAVVIANTTSTGNLLANPVNSNNIIKINSMIAFNSNTSVTGSLIITLFDYSSNISSNIFSVTLPPQSNTFTLIDRFTEINVTEGDTLKCFSNINNSVSVFTNYDILRELLDVPTGI